MPLRPPRRPPTRALPTRIDLHVHFDHDDRDGAHIAHLLTHILERLGALEAQGVTTMATIDEVNDQLNRLGTNLAELAREVGVLVAGGSGATKEQVDALHAKISGLADLAAGADPNPGS